MAKSLDSSGGKWLQKRADHTYPPAESGQGPLLEPECITACMDLLRIVDGHRVREDVEIRCQRISPRFAEWPSRWNVHGR
jgi:hypothetical protein